MYWYLIVGNRHYSNNIQQINQIKLHSIIGQPVKSGASVVVLFSSIPSPCESTYRFSTSKLTCPVVATSFESLQKNLSIVAGRMNNMWVIVWSCYVGGRMSNMWVIVWSCYVGGRMSNMWVIVWSCYVGGRMSNMWVIVWSCYVGKGRAALSSPAWRRGDFSLRPLRSRS